jgi:hypothetical protein
VLEPHCDSGLEDDGRRPDTPAGQPRKTIDNHLAQFRRLSSTEHAMLDARAKGSHDRLRHAEAHVGRPERRISGRRQRHFVLSEWRRSMV